MIIKPEPKPGEWMDPADFATVVRNTPLVSIDLVVHSPEGRILLGHRKNEPAKGFWFVPGSRVSKNEPLANAFARISREELGLELRLEQGSFMGVYEHFYPTNRLTLPGFGTHYIALPYALSLDLPLCALPQAQHGHYAWKSVPELLADPLVHKFTKAYFERSQPTRTF